MTLWLKVPSPVGATPTHPPGAPRIRLLTTRLEPPQRRPMRRKARLRGMRPTRHPRASISKTACWGIFGFCGGWDAAEWPRSISPNKRQLKRNVAIKVLHKDRVGDETYLKRFKTEAMAAGSLSHPNIIQVLMIGEQDGIQYIAQEYVPGMNLREFLARKGPPDWPSPSASSGRSLRPCRLRTTPASCIATSSPKTS